MPSLSGLCILYHEKAKRAGPSHLLDLMLPHWSQEGLPVYRNFGIREQPPVPVVFLHVDLSVVPLPYLDFAKRYSVAINGHVGDIRKTSFSLHQVKPGDDYTGPVIVKSALNYAGIPERSHHPLFPWNERISRRLAPWISRWTGKNSITILDKTDYRIYSCLREVPSAYFQNSNLVIEKFLPERHGNLYCLREWYFLGKYEHNRAELSTNPIFTSAESAPELASPPPAEVRQIREKMGLDYGKIDYVLHEGRGVVFDVNKTTGIRKPVSEAARQVARNLAPGIHDFMPPSSQT